MPLRPTPRAVRAPCPDENRLQARARGEATPDLEQHLDRCPRCRELIAFLLKLRRIERGQKSSRPAATFSGSPPLAPDPNQRSARNDLENKEE
ncbi:MAG TPA: hypothetical protein PK668_10805 [Myxococcota bacterium]|nr:hypothetical protein [Myxococcota bacterium]HRY93347.1 hypothetical protein [Myxococcota bacterium]